MNPAPRRVRARVARRPIARVRPPSPISPSAPDSTELNLERVYSALYDSAGDLRNAARLLGIPRSQLIRFIVQHDSVFAEFRADRRAALILMAEGNIVEALKRGERWAVRFVLSRLGNEHGWSLKPAKPRPPEMIAVPVPNT